MWIDMPTNSISILLSKWLSIRPIHSQSLWRTSIHIDISILGQALGSAHPIIEGASLINGPVLRFILIFNYYLLEKIIHGVIELLLYLTLRVGILALLISTYMFSVFNFALGRLPKAWYVLISNVIDTIQVDFVGVFVIFKGPEAATRAFLQ